MRGYTTDQSHDPRVTVNALSQWLFCPRAALLAIEQGLEDEADSDRLQRWDYIPFSYSEFETARLLRRECLRFLVAIACTLVLGGATFLSFGQTAFWIPFSLGLLTLWPMVALLTFIRSIFVLSLQRIEQGQSQASEPSPDFSEPVSVNWWQLRRAGFQPVFYDTLVDDRLNLAGKPWRVLRRGQLRIPIIRMGSDNQTIYRKHRARIAAYCHLLGACEDADSPYGILLFHRSYDGIAVRNDPMNRKLFQYALAGCRNMLRNCKVPDRPRRSACIHCERGLPRLYQPGVSDNSLGGSILPVHCVYAGDIAYHSLCGDRFEWRPPHEQALTRNMRES